MFVDPLWLWVGFGLFMVIMLVLDLGVFHRKAHEVNVKEALTWSGVWVGLALLFAGGVYLFSGGQQSLEFLTGYLIEWSLSVDNIFVFLLIFSYFAIPSSYQHKVLFWGILGALVMRAVMIGLGAALIEQFHWVIYVFGALLVLSGAKMALQKETGLRPDANPLVKLFRRVAPVTDSYHGDRFFVTLGKVRYATPLFVALLMVESADLMFAVDSVPAIFGITTDPFIVYTSNVFAILGLRSLYFALSGVMHRFHYLKLGLSLILVFVGIKMLASSVVQIPTLLSLGVVVAVLALSVVASILRPQKDAVQVEAAPVKSERAPTHPAG